MGMLAGILTRSQLVASQLAMVLTFLPSFLLSGFMYSIANMPPFLQGLTYVVPARFFVAILIAVRDYLIKVICYLQVLLFLFLFLFLLGDFKPSCCK